MGKDAKAYLSDIILSINLIEHHCKGVGNTKEFQENYLISDAVLRRLAIIGEALAKVTKLNSAIEVSNQKKIIALRHLLVHDYDKIDENIIWPVIRFICHLLKRR